MLRYLVLLVSLICMSLMCSNFAIFHFTVICMKPGHNSSFSSNAVNLLTRYSRRASVQVWPINPFTFIKRANFESLPPFPMLRYLVLLVSLICMSLMCSNFAIFHFTVICMKPGHNSSFSSNETQARDFSSFEEGILFATVSVGRIVGSYPAVKLFDLLGLKTSFTVFGILTGVGSLIVPVFGNSFVVIFVHRVIQ
uniref:MFS domain-containing protein n=3 Tax=Steinernema glaseri TaxID=37863 RepID=A0A1I7YCZ4_9BILA